MEQVQGSGALRIRSRLPAGQDIVEILKASNIDESYSYGAATPGEEEAKKNQEEVPKIDPLVDSEKGKEGVKVSSVESDHKGEPRG